MTEQFDPETFKELLKTKPDGYLYHRESKDLEFKVNFSFSELAEYYRDFAGFANNAGGYLIFGISDRPRRLIGLSSKATECFENIDSARISGDLLDTFSGNIEWEPFSYNIGGLRFGIIYVYKSEQKPIISKKNLGDSSEIKAGEIYFRYAGRTQRIQYSELSYIIEKRIEASTSYLLSLINKISIIGPANAAVLDTQTGLIKKDENHLLVIDEDIITKIKFVREGHFSEREGASTLKLVGEVHPINSVEITKTIQKKLTDQYPFSFYDLRDEIKKRLPNVNQNSISKVIKDENIKHNPQYSAFNFRFKRQEEEYKKTGLVPSGTSSIYNQSAVEFIANVLE